MPNDPTQMLEVIVQRLDAFETFAKTQMQATDSLIAADKIRAADIAQIKLDVALIVEALKAGPRH